MKIKLENCGNIKSSELLIKESTLNIKYGLNGIGKTTLARAINKHINPNYKVDLKTYGSNDEPKIEVEPEISSVKCFNEEYVSKYLFLKNSLNNAYEIVINDDELEKEQKVIIALFDSVLEALREKNIGEFFEKYKSFHDTFSINKDNKSLSSKKGNIASIGIKNGSPLYEIDDELPQKKIMLKNDYGVYIDWFKTGHQFLSDCECPFCATKIDEDAKNNINEFYDVCDSEKIKSYSDSKKQFDLIYDYIPDDLKDVVDTIFKQDSEPSVEQVLKLKELENIISKECDKYDYFMGFQVKRKFNDIDSKELKDLLIEYKFDETQFIYYPEDISKSLISINKIIDDIIDKSELISNHSKELNNIVKKNINLNETIINDFLKLSGMPYEMKVEFDPKKNDYISVLKSSKYASDNINSPIDKLSYGERNSLSLILFALEAIKENPELVIIDDPISSFDQNKKYSMLYTLFSDMVDFDNLRNKTVLLITHDFDIVIDLIKVDTLKCLKKYCTYIFNNDDNLLETEITSYDFTKEIDSTMEAFKDLSFSLPSRLINYRRYLELTNGYFFKERVVNGLLHFENPTYKSKKDGLYHPVELERKYDDGKTILDKIKEDMLDFDYYKWKDELSIYDYKKKYNEYTSSYEKIIITRMYLNKPENKKIKKEEDVLFKYLSEFYHIDLDMVMMLNPAKYDMIPPFLVKLCDTIMLK